MVVSSPITLNAGQDAALGEIMAARAKRGQHLLTGYAGSGKTTLMQEVARRFQAKRLTVVLTAPTHKAVSVLARKVAQAGLVVDCRTIHSLLSLKPDNKGDRQVFVRDKRADPVSADVVVVDECSMLSREMMVHIHRHLTSQFVLFVGDPAQLPPVGEAASDSFATASRSHLDTIVRQADGNPILIAAGAIRAAQGAGVDWTWARSDHTAAEGLFTPDNAAAWMRKAFTSPGFDTDPDSHRYLAWTNAKVDQVNRQVRQWRYGDNIPTPFMPGERAMLRAPVIRDRTVILSTNEEVTVRSVEEAEFSFDVPDADDCVGWTARLACWRVHLTKDDGLEHSVHLPIGQDEYNSVVNRIKDEARHTKSRWGGFHGFTTALAKMQSIYALTVHNSQGSTFKNCFLNVQDIQKRQRSNPLEMQQLLYVGVTRASHSVVLV